MKKKLLTWITLVTLLPLIATLIAKALKGQLIWYMRLTDVLDLVVAGPFMIAAIFSIRQLYLEQLDRNNCRRLWETFSFVALATFIYGYSMHLTANAINTFSTEIRDYHNMLPNDTYQLIFFLDERLGHYLIYLGLFTLWNLFAIGENRNTISSNLSNRSNLSVVLLGLLHGASLAIALIEAEMVWGVLVFCIATGLVFLILLKTTKQSIRDYFSWRPWSRFLATSLVGIVLGSLIYLAIFGGFTEPSQLGL